MSIIKIASSETREERKEIKRLVKERYYQHTAPHIIRNHTLIGAGIGAGVGTLAGAPLFGLGIGAYYGGVGALIGLQKRRNQASAIALKHDPELRERIIDNNYKIRLGKYEPNLENA